MKPNPKNNFIMLDFVAESIAECDPKTGYELFMAYWEYYRNGNEYEGENQLIKLVLMNVYSTIDSMKTKREARIEAGKKGGAPIGNCNAKNKQKQAKTSKNNQTTSKNKRDVDVDVDVDVDMDVDVDEDISPLTPQGEPGVTDPLFENPEVEAEFDNYLEMRKKKKKPATDRAKELARKHLQELSGGDPMKAVEILQQSIINSWTDIYELKEPRETARSGTGKNDKWDAIRELEKELKNEQGGNIGDN